MDRSSRAARTAAPPVPGGGGCSAFRSPHFPFVDEGVRFEARVLGFGLDALRSERAARDIEGSNPQFEARGPERESLGNEVEGPPRERYPRDRPPGRQRPVRREPGWVGASP